MCFAKSIASENPSGQAPQPKGRLAGSGVFRGVLEGGVFKMAESIGISIGVFEGTV